MKNLFHLSFLIGTFINLPAQVAISSNPAYTVPAGVDLSVDGSITVRDKIYAGGDGTTLGNPGKAGQVLVSQGPELPPKWRTLNIPNIEENAFYLIYNEPFTDYSADGSETNEGLSFAATGLTDNAPYNYDATLTNTGFTTINGLTKSFTVNTTNASQVYITFEAVAQINNTGTVWHGTDYACGIFVDDKLKSVRRVTLQAPTDAGGVFMTYTQIALVGDLGQGTYTAKVGCKRLLNLSGYNSNLGIARQVYTPVNTNLNNFMAKSSLKIEVYEIPNMDNGTNVLDFVPPTP